MIPPPPTASGYAPQNAGVPLTPIGPRPVEVVATPIPPPPKMNGTLLIVVAAAIGCFIALWAFKKTKMGRA